MRVVDSVFPGVVGDIPTVADAKDLARRRWLQGGRPESRGPSAERGNEQLDFWQAGGAMSAASFNLLLPRYGSRIARTMLRWQRLGTCLDRDFWSVSFRPSEDKH